MQWQTETALVPYEAALAAMEARVAAISEGREGEMVWLLEHPPLYTAGTSARSEDLLDTARFPIFDAGRGGEYTYHGPGQRVAYAMLDLNARGRDLRAYVQKLEQWMILTLAEFGVEGFTREGRIGVWVNVSSAVYSSPSERHSGAIKNKTAMSQRTLPAQFIAGEAQQASENFAENKTAMSQRMLPAQFIAGEAQQASENFAEKKTTMSQRMLPVPFDRSGTERHIDEKKIAALGIRVRKWVTFHGVALNVHPDLSHYGGIVPCGIRQYGVTSLADMGVSASMEAVDAALKQSFERVFG